MYASATRPLRLRLRPDLEIRAPERPSEKVWVVRDPVTLKYFQLVREEFEIARLLDGRRSLTDLQKHFEAVFSPVRLTLERLIGFLSRLHGDGLLVSDTPGEEIPLTERRRKFRFQTQLAQWSNPLAIRGPGVRPGIVLDRLTSWFGWLFSLPIAFITLLFVVSAVSLVALNWHEVSRRLPQIETFFQGNNFLFLLGTLAGVKVLHELGHAVSCRKFGGRCHEIGLMLLVFTPTLFCDVSDAWMIRERRKRIVISAAGMYVEVLLASAATFLWWLSAPGLFHSLCLNVMLVCSVSTVLMNGNPFLRYDGYYILSDLLGMPNLWQRSHQWWQRTLGRICLGLDVPPEEVTESRRDAVILCVYGLLSTVVRLILLGSILWFVYRFLHTHDVTVLFYPLLAVVLCAAFGPPAKRTVQLMRDPLRRSQMKPVRLAITIAVLALAVLFVGFVPLPAYVYCPMLLEPLDAQYFYARQEGRLVEISPANARVEAGELVFRLENEAFEFELADLEGEWRQQEIRVKTLEARRFQSSEIENELPFERARLVDLQTRYEQLRLQQQQLQGIAQRAGTVFHPPYQQALPRADLELPTYSGSPLDPLNRGSWIESGTLLCIVGDADKLQATLLADENQLELLEVDQQAELLPAADSSESIAGRVVEIGRTREETAPERLLPDDRLPVVRRVDGSNALAAPMWKVRVRWDGRPPELFPGMRGVARIRVASMTLFARFRRWVSATFRVAE